MCAQSPLQSIHKLHKFHTPRGNSTKVDTRKSRLAVLYHFLQPKKYKKQGARGRGCCYIRFYVDCILYCATRKKNPIFWQDWPPAALRARLVEFPGATLRLWPSSCPICCSCATEDLCVLPLVAEPSDGGWRDLAASAVLFLPASRRLRNPFLSYAVTYDIGSR